MLGAEAMEEPVEDMMSRWLQLHQEGDFTSRNVREYWQSAVPCIYAPQATCSPMLSAEQEEQANKKLLDPLHTFITGLPNYEPIYASIREMDTSPSLCGRVFNSGEPTYGCRDCGFDPTCVLCPDCFKASPHTKHRYTMSTSAGGGYCDCGDTEAWRDGAYCARHVKTDCDEQTAGASLDLLTQTHAAMASRLQVLMETIIDYTMEVLPHGEGIALSKDLELLDVEPTRNKTLYQMRDTFCAVLYNDESHTYDQVISALERSIKCSKKEAVAFVTYIDRAGRCVVRCSGLQQCQNVKSVMDRQAHYLMAKPFTVKIYRAHVQAHQTFAMTLLTWLDKLLNKANCIKSIFAQIMFEIMSGRTMTRVEQVMWMDNELCKAARIQWHKLFIAGLLMDLPTKKNFARVFTKHYSKMMKSFINDEHEHSVCMVSLGVQLFTMPTIAHLLIAEEAVIAKLLLTFIAEVNTRIKNGKLVPLSQNAGALDPGSMTPTEFRRVQFILFDLKYLLGMVPTQWTDRLRKGFLHGFSQFLRIMVLMQNMDPVTRKEGSHVEFEQEWEGAFNLHIKMSPLLPQLMDWAASDRVVLIKCMRMLQKCLLEHGCEGLQKRFMREAANCTVSCIEYDVAKSPVSMHIPLTRLAGYMATTLHNYGLSYNSTPEFPVKEKPSLKELIEPSLRTVVMIAQCKAGMWRRNGLSLTNQTYFYRNVRCRQDMWDKDILILQCAASLMEPDDFLITLLNRFSLMSWQRSDYESTYMWGHDEENMRQTVVILEELMHMLLYILGERYFVGVGQVEQDDIIKNEVIHLLCIQDMTHSSINNLLTERTNHETGMERIIGEIADFKKHSDDVKGYYSLKTKYYKHYNIFFYHYSKEEQSRSEVQHRERCKKISQDEACCPPPAPPALTAAYTPLLGILNCAVFRHVLTQLITRWCDVKSASVSETSVRVALHVIGLACYEEFRTPGFLSNPQQLVQHLQDLQSAKKSEPILSLVNWTKSKLASALSPGGSDVSEQPAAASRSPAEISAAASSELDEKQRKADLANARKKRILDKMADMQKNFMKINKDQFNEAADGINQEPAAPEVAMEVIDVPLSPVALGPLQTLPAPSSTGQTCIVCHLDETLNTGAADETLGKRAASAEEDDDEDDDDRERLLVVGVMVQASTVLSKRDRLSVVTSATEQQPSTEDGATNPVYRNYLPSDLHGGIHVSSCGHPMHVDCWKLYYSKVVQKEQRRTFRMSLNFDVERSEYLCPLCESVCNNAVALLPATSQPLVAGTVRPAESDLSPALWIQGLRAVALHKTERQVKTASDTPSLKSVKDEEEKDESLPAVSGRWLPPPLSAVVAELSSSQPGMADSFTEMFSSSHNMCRSKLQDGAEIIIMNLAHSLFKHGLDENPNLEDERILGTSLVALSYTLRAFEVTQRHDNRALLTNMTERQNMFLAALTATVAYLPSTIAERASPMVSTSACMSTLADVLGEACVLEWDTFSVLVSLTLCLPSIFSSTRPATAKGGLQDFYLLHMCLLGHVTQLLLTYDDKAHQTVDDINDDCPMEVGSSNPVSEAAAVSECEWLKRLLRRCRAAAGVPDTPVDEQRLQSYVKDNCLPFLRCCGLFFHLLTGCSAPEELRSSVWVPESEYLCLVRYLGLSSISTSLQPYESLIDGWLSHSRLRECAAARRFNGHKCLDISQLAPLAPDYSELITEVSCFVCPSSTVGDKSSTPTICLVCGATMCSQTYCCQSEVGTAIPRQVVGSTSRHAQICGSGSCIFLRVPDCRLILRTGRYRGCYYSPPYLDQYGETDQGLRRGNPLFLNAEHHNKLHSLWLHHLLPETISRIIVPNVSNINTNTDWQHL